MCGIAGIWDTKGGLCEKQSLERMGEAIAHRGPDGKGSYVSGSIGFVHRRLSIIDVTSAGAQPFISEDGRYMLTFNGEIYNYRELRSKYFSEDTFVSNSDTEVLMKMLMRFHGDALSLLRGMFAFAFFDTQDQKLLLATDMFGKKPLFYAWAGENFLFASEPKALIASGYIHPEISNKEISQYLLHEYVPTPYAGFSGVFSLGPGEVFEIGATQRRIAKWTAPQVAPKVSLSFKDAMKRFDQLLGVAVERRMVADVPVGLFLSGGLDSSTIAWYMRHIRKEGEIHSCSVSFDDQSFNEEPIASIVASDLSLTHHAKNFSAKEFISTLQEIIPYMDVPFADISLLPTYMISKTAREHMKVVLDGDGSDELLGGYGTFSAYELSRRGAAIPSWVWSAAEAMVRSIPVSHSYFSFDFKLKSFLRGASYPSERNMQVWLGAFTEQEQLQLLKSEKQSSIRELFESVDFAVSPHVQNSFDRASLYHVATYMNRDILVKIDRATMSVGLEARTPFLDSDFAEFVLRLPDSYKRNKRILRELMKGRISEDVILRKKQGFGIPSGSWFSKELLSFVYTILSRDRIEAVGVFTYAYVERLLREHRDKTYDHRKKIWTLISFQLWYEYWILGKRDIL